jgi:hypothetical protein
MNLKDRITSFGINFRDLRRGILMLACPAIILWLGGDAITRVSELYDGLRVSGRRDKLTVGHRPRLLQPRERHPNAGLYHGGDDAGRSGCLSGIMVFY